MASVMPASPAQALMSRCRGTDLLVVGASRPDGERGSRSVAAECVGAAPCPATIVPHVHAEQPRSKAPALPGLEALARVRTLQCTGQGAGDDHRVEGRGGVPPDRGVLRLPPQPGDLDAVRLDLPTAADLLQVGRDGGHRVAPRPPCAVCCGWTATARGTSTSRGASAVTSRC